MDLDQVLPKVYVGSCPLNTADIDRLQQEFGITAVLNVQTEDDFAYWGINWEQFEAHYRRQGIAVRRVPIRDFDPYVEAIRLAIEDRLRRAAAEAEASERPPR